jgi:hypothetical protein
MALLAAQFARAAGTTITFASAAGGGDTINPTPSSVLHVRNGSGSSINVTVVVPGSDEFGNARPDIVVAVAAGAHAAIGPLSSPLLPDPADGLIDITYSSATTVTVAHISNG